MWCQGESSLCFCVWVPRCKLRREYLRFNAADYKSLKDGARVLRHFPLPAELYASPEDHELACWTLQTLRATFK